MMISKKFLKMLIEQEVSKQKLKKIENPDVVEKKDKTEQNSEKKDDGGVHFFHGNQYPPSKVGLPGPDFVDDAPVSKKDLEAASNHLKNNQNIDELILFSRGAAVFNKLAKDPEFSKNIEFPEVTYVGPAAKRKWGAAGLPAPKVHGRVVASAGDGAIPIKQACKIADEAGIPLYVTPGKFKDDNWKSSGMHNHVGVVQDYVKNKSGSLKKQLKNVSNCANSAELPDWGQTESASNEDFEKQFKVLQDEFDFKEEELKTKFEKKKTNESKKLPFFERKLTDGRVARLFESTTDDAELGWHRDREDRIVEVVAANGWSFQRDDELPVLMQEGDVISIPALEWHRVVRGHGPLIVVVEKLPLQEGKRRVRKSYLRGTRNSNKEMRREIDKCAKEPRPKSCYEDWTADKTYRRSRKAKRNPYVKSEGLLVGEVERIIEESIVPVDEVVAEAVLLMAEAKLSEKTRKALKNKAEKSNAPLGALTAVYRKGLAAWLTGHRQGVSQHQWAMGRLNSFLSGGKARKVDKKEWAMVQRHRSK